jgi:hypothetical protein
MKKILTIAILATTFSVSQAQESWINVLRSDVRTQVSALVEVAMEFTDEEAEAFWPIYREFELEMSKIGDQRIAGIKDYGEHFESMTDEKADELVKMSQDLVKKRNDVNRGYHKKFRKVLSGTRAARFYQVNRAIQNLIDLQIQAELPLVQEALTPAATEDEGM